MKQIPGYENYSITEDGKVYSHKRNIYLKNQEDKNGYYRTTIYNSGRRSKIFTHRLVAITYINNPDNKPQINHLDGNKKNNHVDNLEWCTAKENKAHAMLNNLIAREETNGMSKLTASQIESIKLLVKEGKSTANEIGSQFNISANQILEISKGRCWPNIRPDLTIKKKKRKLSEEDVVDIYKRYNQVQNMNQVAREFNVNSGTINDIVKGKTRKSLYKSYYNL